MVVFNKIDNFEPEEEQALRDKARLLSEDAFYVSAHTGEGTDALKEAISDALNAKLKTVQLLVPHSRYDVVSRLHQSGGIREQENRDDGVYIVGLFPPALSGVFNPFIVSA